MRQIQIEEATFNFRSDWSEIEPDLLLRLAPLLFTGERAEAQAQLVTLICDVPPILLASLEDWQYAQLYPLTDWLWDTPLTTPIIPQFEHAGQTWYLPAAELLDPNFAYIEWSHLDTFLSNFFSGDLDALPQICATLARPADPNRQSSIVIRKSFDAQQLDKDAATLRSLSHPLTCSLLLLASGCSRHIRDQYAILWEPDEDTNDTASDYSFASQTGDTDFGWTGAAFSIAESRAFGTFNQVMYTDAHTILYYLSWKKQQDRTARRMMKKLEKK
jgi:hypothetical protein